MGRFNAKDALKLLDRKLLFFVAWGVAFAEQGPRDHVPPAICGGPMPGKWDRAEVLRRLEALTPERQVKPLRVLRDIVAQIRRGKHGPQCLGASMNRGDIRLLQPATA